MKDLIMESMSYVVNLLMVTVPKLFVIFIILVVGLIIAKVITKLIHRVLKEIPVDKLTTTLGVDEALHKGGIKHSVSDLLGTFVYWTIVLMTFIMAVKTFGLPIMDGMLEKIFGYIPHVLSGVVILSLGMIFAHFVSGIVKVVIGGLDMPKPDLLGTLTKWVIVLYSVYLFLGEIGLGFIFEGTTIFTGVLVLALGIAFGLGGKEIATKYLDKIFK